MLKRLATILLLCGAPATSAWAQGPSNVLLVVNESSPESVSIGRYYAVKRGLPDERVCPIRTEPVEKVSRRVFEDEIQEPIAKCLTANLLHDEILYLVTTKGVPLTVLGDAGPVGDLASVDSELALLYQRLAYGAYTVFGRVDNPYFTPAFASEAARPFSHESFPIYLVTRLTGPTTVDVIFMIDRSVEAGRSGGFFFDLPSARESAESDWIGEAVQLLRSRGFEVEVDSTASVIQNRTSVLGYCGLAGSDPNFKPDLRMGWNAGALAIALDRDSASSFLPTEAPESAPGLVGASFVASGVTGFGGQVADPSLDGQIRPQVVFPAYVSGFNLAESYYQGIRYLSWREVVVGDPLTSPFADRLKRPVAEAGLDPETGLPAEFAKRRTEFLKTKYLTTDEAVVPLLVAERLRDQGRLAEALPWLQKSLNADPLIVETHLLTATAFRQAGDPEQSFRHLQRAVELGDSTEKTYRLLAEIALNELQNPEKALPYARSLLARFGSSNPDYVYLWAAIQFQLGQLDEAAAYYTKLTKDIQPAPPAALAGLARVEHQRENWERARQLLRQALGRLEEGEETGRPQDPGHGPLREELRVLLEDCDRRLAVPGGDRSPEAGAGAAPGDSSATPEVQPARALTRVLPEYPPAAKERGLEGIVVLRLLIDENGQLVKVRRVYGDQLLAKAFEKAVVKWTFAPRLVNGKPEPSWIHVPLHFKLREQR